MSVLSFHRLRSGPLRQPISILLLAVVACSIVGLPLTAPTAAKHGRFPCEDCPCGCSTAAFCWDKCCCHSDAEKLEWAAENDVTPPAFLVARASAAEKRTVASGRESSQPTMTACGCCSGPKAAADQAPEAASCELPAECELPATCGLPAEPASASSATGIRIVRLEDAAKCRGITWLWSLFAEVVVARSDVLITAPQPRLLFCLAIENDRALGRASCPDPPVP
ncbi:hypothetical protein [Allorhodopirellula solitaria]|uniref:hypothetical protein n=1 Tax=Allorhodopirellula solitaria TaxID=2527987 RepID=UPI0011B42B8D|nr:hypothetical protein [Allorhodopirellula solitaria]